jgi:NADH-quinone oxidoreductase subunit E
VQGHFGYLPGPALAEISHRTRIRLSRVYGVVSFYAQFYTEPHGRHMIRCCRGTACYVRGGQRVIDAVKAELGVEEEQTTEDMMFTLQTVACLGACALGPLMVVDSTYHGNMDPRKALRVLQMYQEDSG